MASPKIERTSSRALCGEGPHWDHEAQVLYFVDVLNSEVRKYDPSNSKETVVKIEGGRVTFVIPIQDQKNKFVIGSKRDIAIMTWDGVSNKPSNIERIGTVDEAEGIRDNRVNDAKADAVGRLWTGTMGPYTPPLDFALNRGSLFSLSKDKKITTHVSGITLSNGLAWSLDNTIMYYIDSLTKKVDAFDYDIQKGQISNRRIVFDFIPNNVKGIPDGMTIDTEGKLWIACFDGSQVIQIDPTTGKLLNTITMPAPYITSVTFGGPQLDELYVTSASMNMSDEERKTNLNPGSTFRVTGTGAKGFPGQPVIF